MGNEDKVHEGQGYVARGRRRGQDEMEAAAKANADVAKFLDGKTIVKVVAVPKRMVNFVIR